MIAIELAEVLWIGVAGFLASLIDGALGMGFGATSSTILLAVGVNPAAVATTVNIAKIASGGAAGVSHWRLGNIDRRLVVRLAVPGALGAVIGAVILTRVDADQLRPVLAGLLIVLALRILVRFSSTLAARPAERVDDEHLRGVTMAGLAGGVTNGMIGAWGPVVTPFLLHRRLAPRIVVGSVNTAEVAVAVVAAGSLLSASPAGLSAAGLAAMLVGGVVAAPLAAITVRRIPARILGVLVAGLLLITNVRELAGWGELGAVRWVAYLAVVALVAVSAGWPRLKQRNAAAASALVG